MIKRFLTPDELSQLDPTGKGRAFLESLHNAGALSIDKFWKVSSEKAFEDYIKLRSNLYSARHESYLAYDREHDCKYGGQGGSLSLDGLSKLAQPYFDTNPVCDCKAAKAGLDYLLALIRARIEKYGLPSPIPAYRGVCGTNAALPSWGKKGSYVSETIGMRDWRHAYPATPGHRYMRLKHRLIFQSSNCNVRYIEEYLARVRFWLRRYVPEYFSGWLNPATSIEVAANSIVASDFVSCEDDYDACDVHTGFPLVSSYVLPVYELLLSPNEFMRMAAFVEETFESPLFMGDYVLEGKHSLFSGEPFTNDFETIYDAVQSISTAIETNIAPTHIVTWSNGDDVTNILVHKKDLAKAEEFHSNYAEIARCSGHVISSQKSRTSDTDIRFCRKVYYRAGKRAYNSDGFTRLIGAYPTILTLNSVRNPEQYTNLIVGATFQRLDNAIGSYFHEPLVQYVVSNTRIPRDVSMIDLHAPLDWWERLYGESWNPLNSPSVQIAIRSRLIRVKS